jgi:hypothetical protein
LEENAKLNNLTGTITMASGLTAKFADLSLTDSAEGTYVWTHLEEECPRTRCSCTGDRSRSSLTGHTLWRAA